MASVSGSRLWDRPHDERVGVVRDETNRVVAALNQLDAGQLDRPAIGNWTIREVVAHLGVVADFYTDSINRGSVGDASVAGDRPKPGTGRGATAGAAIRQRAAEVADGFGDEVIDVMHRNALRLVETLDTEESSLEFECYHPGGIIAANRFVVLFLKELGLHEWDMFEALHPPHEMSRWGIDAALQAMEEELASGSLRWVTGPDAIPDSRTLRLVTSGDVVVERDLILEPQQTRLVPIDELRNVDSRLSLDGADFVLGCSGRRDLVTVVSEGRGEGDMDALRVLARRLTGM